VDFEGNPRLSRHGRWLVGGTRDPGAARQRKGIVTFAYVLLGFLSPSSTSGPILRITSVCVYMYSYESRIRETSVSVKYTKSDIRGHKRAYINTYIARVIICRTHAHSSGRRT